MRSAVSELYDERRAVVFTLHPARMIEDHMIVVSIESDALVIFGSSTVILICF